MDVTPRWAYLRAFIESTTLDRGHGTGPVLNRVTADERAHARQSWNAILIQYRRWSERCAWLYDNEGAPDWDALNERCGNSERKLSDLQLQLREWAGASEDEWIPLYLEVIDHLAERAERMAA